jgi:predicted phage-related endonuclease
MVNRKDIIQGSDEWHRLRWGKIGGSTSKGLFVKSDTLLIELVSEITEQFEYEESFVSDDMIRGNELEPIAREQVNQYTGINFLQTGWLQCEEISLLGISPDGLSECEKYGLEIKCPNRKKHTKTVIENEIPSDNIHQCLHYFTVNPKLEKLYFCSYRPESVNPLFIKELTNDSKIDLGTKAKPNVKSVSEWVIIAKNEAVLLQKEIDKTINQISF